MPAARHREHIAYPAAVPQAAPHARAPQLRQ
jgi:hypothetical protein